MSDERKSSDFEARLWRAAQNEPPSAEARDRALTAALAGLGPPPSAPNAAKAATLSKVVGLVVVAGVVATALVGYLRAPSPVAAEIPSLASVPSSVPAPEPAPIGDPSMAVLPAPVVASTASVAPRVNALPAPSIPPRLPTLADEIVPIDRAHAALSRGDTGAALRALDDFDRQFPQGTLAPEAAVLRIETLARMGNSSAAADKGRAFLATHAASPLAARVRRVLGAIDAGAP